MLGRGLAAMGMVGVLATAQGLAPTFAPTGSLNRARAGPMAARLANGEVLLAGGGEANQALRSAELYDPASGRFTVTGSLTQARPRAAAVGLRDGRVLVVDGNSAESYNPGNGTFRAAAALPVPLEDAWAVGLADGRVMVSGRAAGGRSRRPVEIYDPAQDRFALRGELGVARQGTAAAVLLRSGQVLVVGGGAAEIYDPGSGTARRTTGEGGTRAGVAAARLASGEVLVCGGGAGALAAEIYDPARDRFYPTGSLLTPRAGAVATLLGDGTVLVAGGIASDSAQEPPHAEIYHPAPGMPGRGRFADAGLLEVARSGFSATRLANGQVLLAGGWAQGGRAALASAELFAPGGAASGRAMKSRQ